MVILLHYARISRITHNYEKEEKEEKGFLKFWSIFIGAHSKQRDYCGRLTHVHSQNALFPGLLDGGILYFDFEDRLAWSTGFTVVCPK